MKTKHTKTLLLAILLLPSTLAQATDYNNNYEDEPLVNTCTGGSPLPTETIGTWSQAGSAFNVNEGTPTGCEPIAPGSPDGVRYLRWSPFTGTPTARLTLDTPTAYEQFSFWFIKSDDVGASRKDLFANGDGGQIWQFRIDTNDSIQLLGPAEWIYTGGGCLDDGWLLVTTTLDYTTNQYQLAITDATSSPCVTVIRPFDNNGTTLVDFGWDNAGLTGSGTAATRDIGLDNITFIGDIPEPIPPTTVDPNEFTQAIDDIVNDLGFVSPESRILLTVFLTGALIVGTSAATRKIKSGLIKNSLIFTISTAFAIASIFLLGAEGWMVTTATAIGLSFMLGAPKEAQNTYHDLRQNIGRLGMDIKAILGRNRLKTTEFTTQNTIPAELIPLHDLQGTGALLEPFTTATIQTETQPKPESIKAAKESLDLLNEPEDK